MYNNNKKNICVINVHKISIIIIYFLSIRTYYNEFYLYILLSFITKLYMLELILKLFFFSYTVLGNELNGIFSKIY